MQVLRIDDHSPYLTLVGVGGLGTGIFFELEGNGTLGRSESRLGRLLDVRDYCKLHIVIHYVAKLLGAHPSGRPFHVVPVGKVGSDAAGRRVTEEMGQVGIDTSKIEISPSSPTLFSVCFQYPDGNGGNITTNNSAAAELSRSDVEGAASIFRFAEDRVIALAVPEVGLEVRQRFLQVASEAGAFRAASFATAEVKPARNAGMFGMLDLVALNEGEAEELLEVEFNPDSLPAFIQRCQELLRDSFPRLKLVVSVGKGGAYGITADGYNFCPAPEVKVASTAGAGDSLLGGIIAAMAAGIPFFVPEGVEQRSDRIQTAVELGVLLGSYKCLSPHTINPDASLDSLIEFAKTCGRSFSAELKRKVVEVSPARINV